MRGLESGPVVAAVDRSASSARAARWAAELAAATGRGTRIVHVQSPAAAADRAPEWLATLAEGLPGAVVATVRTAGDGLVAELVRVAEDAGLLVIGSDGEGAGGGVRVGSTALGLLDRAGCPVAVVRGATPSAAPPATGRVLVGVDDSPTAAGALDLAAELAEGLGSTLLAVHTWRDVEIDPVYGAEPRPGDWDQLAAKASTLLDGALAGVTADRPGLDARRRLVRDSPLRALLDLAPDARMIIVGSRGLGAGARMMLGSTSRALVEFAPCPVVVVRPGGRALPPA
jgi:nucleotide-binding universal stress UspA family protein